LLTSTVCYFFEGSADTAKPGAGTGGATKNVLESLNGNFSSYTYTDISAGFFEKASELFKVYNRKMTFKLFDVEKTPAEQGYEEYSYDMIIASNVLHATKTMQNTMENTRRLLKPGGYLMLLEVTNNGPIRISNMTAGLSGWWVGVGDGRRYAPTISPSSWNSLLRKTGFSGVDAITPERDVVAWPFSVIATQAVNERVNFLRKPLRFSSLSTKIGELVILGNESLDNSRIAEDVVGLLWKYCDKVILLENLPTHDDKITPMSTFVNLVDIDEPIFKNITAKKMNGLKRLFELSKNVLWITKGARVEEPYHMSSIGFGRAISHEMPHIRLQFLDLPNLEDNVSQVIAESVLRLHFAEEWAEGDLQAKLLWTKEPQLVLEKGQLLVPRILPNEEQNSRLNSFRRPVTKIVDPQTSAVQISQASDTAFILREETLKISRTESNLIHISHSVLCALNVARESFLFLGIGTTRKTNNTIVSLSQSNSSIVVSSTDMYVDIPADQKLQFLSAVTAELLAACLVAEIPRNSTLLVHEPGQCQFFDLALTRRAADKGIHVTFSTISSDIDDVAKINISPWASERLIKMKLSATLTHFLDLSVNGAAKVTGCRILQFLPPACKRIGVSTLFRGQSLLPKNHDIALSQALEDAVVHAKTDMSVKALNTARLSNISDPAVAKSPATIVDWTADNTVVVKVQPLNAEHLFSKDKTYLLVGLTGQIGQSICEWMARNGAGTICLTSRHPNIPSDWLKSFEGSGTDVKFFAMYEPPIQDWRM
jgi:hybrid polyketide synthase / nonribosomal peptide synthetase ACE1